MPAVDDNNSNNKNRSKLRNSTRIALSGILCSLSVLLMFMTGLVPFFQYALPAMSGLLLVIVVLEDTFSTGIVAYIATSIIVFLISPDQEAAILYIMFFGHYGVLKTKIDTLNSKFIKYLLKLLTFNVSVITAYYLIAFIFGMDVIMDSFGGFGKYSLLLFLLAGNVVFFLYDYAISNMIEAYESVIRPKYLGFLK